MSSSSWSFQSSTRECAAHALISCVTYLAFDQPQPHVVLSNLHVSSRNLGKNADNIAFQHQLLKTKKTGKVFKAK